MSNVAHNVNENVSISALIIQLAEHTRPFKSAVFAVNKEEREVQWTQRERTLEATFEPPLRVSPSDQLEFHLRRSLSLGPIDWFDKDEVIPPIDASQFTNASSSTEGNTREWRHLFKGNEIIFRLSLGPSTEDSTTPIALSIPALPPGHIEDPSTSQSGRLVPTTDEITRICPKFRILLVGKTGVGKSSLINQAFRVDNAEVSHSMPGKADINEGIDHHQFILHDSQGFEPGEVQNLNTVRDFIKTRDRMPDLKNKLHAIWICIATPATGGRILETGVEDILLLRRNGELGKVPIIIVLTKYDALVKREDRLFDDSHCEEEEIPKLVRKKALATLEADCIVPLKNAIGAEILCVAVSTQEGYQDTLEDLIKLTFDNVKEHVAREASIVAAMAQKVNSDVKVEALIDVGKFKYWSGLTSSTPFTGRKLLECLEVIHADIVNVWSLNDPDMILRNKTFIMWMSEMVDKISMTDLRNPNTGLTASLPVLATIATIVSVVSGPAAPIVVPIAAGVVFAKWVYDVYQNSKHVLKRLMAYIVDLTLIMQQIFCLMQGKQYTISHRVVNIISAAYDRSSVKANVHREIVEHVDKSIINLPGARDTTFQKIVELIKSNVLRVDSAQSSELQSIVKPWEGEDGPSCNYQFNPLGARPESD